MTSWMKERDRLVEQTLAFVQGVAAQRPIQIVTAEPSSLAQPAAIETAEVPEQAAEADTDPASAETDALTSLMALSQPAQSRDRTALPPEPIASVEMPNRPRVATKPRFPKPAGVPSIQMAMPERDVIAQRVARFRAGQQKLIRDRDENYALVQAKIRASLGSDPLA